MIKYSGCITSLEAKVSILYRSIYKWEIHTSYRKGYQFLAHAIALANKRCKIKEFVCNMRRNIAKSETIFKTFAQPYATSDIL